MLDIISELNIPKSDYTLNKEYFWYDTKYDTIPDIINKNIKDVKKNLSNFNIKYSGNGNIVKAISPTPETILPYGSTIKILLGN